MSYDNTSPGQDASGVGSSFDPTNVNLDTADATSIICYLQSAQNEYDGGLGARVSALFVILIVSTAATLFPVLATKVPRLRIPVYVYLFARYFGAGVIVATAFIHLLDPAYSEIGPQTCVGMTGGWASYSWCPAIVLTSTMVIFLMDFASERYVEKKYGLAHGIADADNVTGHGASFDAAMVRYSISDRTATNQHLHSHQHLHSGEVDPVNSSHRPAHSAANERAKDEVLESGDQISLDSKKERLAEIAFRQQIAAFLILEFGVIFHSVIIGLTLGTAGYSDFSILYPVIVFHQAFEGLGIGARLSAIAFPRKLGGWMPWALCVGYGLSTPIAVAVGLGVRETYVAGSFTANIISGVLDATSAGILIYTGLVELLARDFLFNPERTQDDKQLLFMVFCVFLGAGLMALLGKWA